ncbi:MAG: hypothetical protein EXR02_04705 [Rhodospirillales bacterium]|nr:hypothetical protein [Rhodospirillales bacterium]
MRIKAQRTWILVADGARAHVVTSAGPGMDLKLVPGSDVRHELLPTREIGTDRPGRTQESVGGARHAIAPPGRLAPAAERTIRPRDRPETERGGGERKLREAGSGRAAADARRDPRRVEAGDDETGHGRDRQGSDPRADPRTRSAPSRGD